MGFFGCDQESNFWSLRFTGDKSPDSQRLQGELVLQGFRGLKLMNHEQLKGCWQ